MKKNGPEPDCGSLDMHEPHPIDGDNDNWCRGWPRRQGRRVDLPQGENLAH